MHSSSYSSFSDMSISIISFFFFSVRAIRNVMQVFGPTGSNYVDLWPKTDENSFIELDSFSFRSVDPKNAEGLHFMFPKQKILLAADDEFPLYIESNYGSGSTLPNKPARKSISKFNDRKLSRKT